MIIEKYDRTLLFYGLSPDLPWTFWSAAAYPSRLSHPGPSAMIRPQAMFFSREVRE